MECLGIERLFASLNLAALNPSSQIEPLAEQALFNIDIDWTKIRMSSLHIASKQGLHHLVYKCILKMYQQSSSDGINVIDSNGCTPLHYAVEHQHQNVTKLLISRGGDVDIRNKSGQSPLELIKNDNEGMHTAIGQGMDLLKNARLAMNQMICSVKICGSSDDGHSDHDDEDLIVLPIEIGQIIVSFIDSFEIMDSYGDDEFSTKNLSKSKHSNECLTSYYVNRDNDEDDEMFIKRHK